MVTKQNMGGSEKEYMGSRSTYKDIPKADGLKEFRQPSTGDKGMMDRDHSDVKANIKNWNNHPHN